jgi:sulfite reductase (NADPH) hemoprotein beta-component
MYRYDEFDSSFVDQRVAQFRGQVARRLAGELSEDEFKPLRLMNGLYLQLHAYMLRVAIPYGTLSAAQMRMLAHIARRYDKGYGHFTTRQNIQYNWPRLEDVADILADLASVQMHAIQTSGNCIRNVTADQYAGVAGDEIEDPRVYAEIVRQWSTLHPEFSFLPRKFKIAVTGSPNDRAAIRVHDIGLRMHRNEAGEVGFEVVVGGGQGRTPIIAKTIREFLPKQDLLSYLEAMPISRRPPTRRWPTTRRSCPARAAATAISPTGSRATPRPTKRRATPSSICRSSRPAGCPATPPRRRWTRWPSLPSAMG